MEEVVPGVNHKILSYIIGLDSLKTASISDDPSSWRTSEDIRLRMDGLFELKDHAVQFTKEFIALYTNGPAGGGGVRLFYYQLVRPLLFKKCGSILLPAWSKPVCFKLFDFVQSSFLSWFYYFSLAFMIYGLWMTQPPFSF